MVGLLELPKMMIENEFYQWLAVTVFFSMLSSWIDMFLFTNLFKIQAKNSKKIQLVLLDTVLRISSAIFIPAPYYRAINIIVTIILFKIFFKKNIEKCILGEVINTITIICAEVIFSKLLCVLLNYVETYLSGIFNFKYKFFLMLSISLSRLIICYVVKKKNIKINISDNLSKNNKRIIIIISIIGCMIIFFNAVEMMLFIADFPYAIFLLDIVSLVIYFYISMKDIFRISKLEEQDMKIQNLESYNKTLSIMYDSIRGFRHDFNNFVQALDGYVRTNDIEGIKVMCKSVVGDCRNVNNMEILDPRIINNPAIYSVITNKYYLAQKENITMNIEVMIDLKSMKIPNYELCRILAILLDNSIEASKECDEKIVNVRFEKDTKANRNLVIIENTYSKLDIDIDKIFEKGYSTKDDENNEHGLGLWTVRKILSKSDNLNLFTTKRDKIFCQQLEIYN